MISLGLCYEKGDFVNQDKRKAVELFQRAADLGNSQGMVYLGRHFETGFDDIKPDLRRAVELCQRAAD